MAKRPEISQSQRGSRFTPFFCASAIYLAACLVLGGATWAAFIADVVLQFASIPLLLWATWRLLDVPSDAGGTRGRIVIFVALAAAAIPAAQLIPLPPSIWAALPGRSDAIELLEVARLDAGWRPLSTSPRATWLSALALLPPVTILLCAIQLSYVERRRLALVLLIIAVTEAALGLLQLVLGPSSCLRIFAFRNQTEAVGFFANRNHFAAFLYCLVPLAAAFALTAASDAARAGRMFSRRATAHWASSVIFLAMLVVLLAALAMARSRAGLALMLVALLGAFAMTYAAPTGGVEHLFKRVSEDGALGGRRLLLAALLAGLLLGGYMAAHRIHERFAVNPLADGRGPLFKDVMEAAWAHMPFGAGMGTFVTAFQEFERPAYGFGEAYVNRAHNEYLELWLEAGLIGLVAMSLFLVWWASSIARICRAGLPAARRRDNLLACAAMIAPTLLLLHAFVDYPLRTSALMAVFAFATAFAIAPVTGIALTARSRESVRHERREASIQSRGEGVRRASPPQGRWPTAWQQEERSRATSDVDDQRSR